MGENGKTLTVAPSVSLLFFPITKETEPNPNSAKMTFSRPQKLAPFILNALLASFMMTSTSAGSSHYSLPSEDNVFSPPICTTNQDGFGGTIGTDVLTIDYNYEMEVVVGADVNDVLFSVERSIADYLLQTDEFADIPCDDRRLKAAESIAATRREARRLNAVGLTVNPPDLPIDGGKYFLFRTEHEPTYCPENLFLILLSHFCCMHSNV